MVHSHIGVIGLARKTFVLHHGMKVPGSNLQYLSIRTLFITWIMHLYLPIITCIGLKLGKKDEKIQEQFILIFKRIQVPLSTF